MMKTQFWSFPAAALGLVLITAVLSLAEENKSDTEKFSRRECRWAAKWINSELSFLMGKGVFKKIISKDNLFEVRIGEPWYKMEFSRKGELLQSFSRARQITGHSPFFRLIDDETKETVADISESAIEILLPGEGFFQYMLSSNEARNTFY